MKIKEKPQRSADLIESMMLNRGIEDIQLFLTPNDKDDTCISELPNITEAIEIVQRNIGKEILILVDSDADGNSSAAIMYKYLKFVNPYVKLSYFIHAHKTHGLTAQFMEHVEKNMPNLVIVPDAGTNDIKQRERIVELGIDLIVIDHHNEDKYTDKGGILINNHAKFPENSVNKNLTGAGMTYLFCKALDEVLFHTNKIEKLKDLAMIGTIGDCASLAENETRKLCMDALYNIESQMLKTVIETNKQDLNDITFTNMQYGGIVPLINAVIRVGTYEEKELMFKALADIETDYFKVVEKRKLNKETRKYEKIPFNLNIYELAIDAAQACRARQNKAVEKEMKLAAEQFNPKGGIQVYVVQTDDCKPLTGLLANKLTSLWQQPVICVLELNTGYSGSLRGWEKSLKNFKGWCESTGLFTLVQGHDNAAGVAFTKENKDKIIKAGETVEYEEFYVEVDKIYNGKASMDDILYIDKNINIFKNGIQQPVFAVKNVQVNAANAKWSKNTMRINIDGVTYIKFKTPEDEFNDLINTPNCMIDIVGSFSVNEWNYSKYPQMMIDEYDLSEDITYRNNVEMFGVFA